MAVTRSRSTGRALRLLARLPRVIPHDSAVVESHIREGRFQRSLALIAGFSSVLSGLEVVSEHYRGSYSQRVMYTPIILSPALLVAGIWGAISRRAARTVLPVISVLTMLDGVVGFYYHVKGIARKPGGWRIPVVNVVMGPPVLAPLLFGLSGFLGALASLLRREDEKASGRTSERPHAAPRRTMRPPVGLRRLPRFIAREGIVLAQDVREGRFQRFLAAAAGISAVFSGIEALYSHYRNNFRYTVPQWSPIMLTPVLFAAGIGSVWSRTIARTLLPIASLLALVDGGIGTIYHLRGVLRRPGGISHPARALYNVMYGPPLFAPLLFSASGFVGLLASVLRRNR